MQPARPITGHNDDAPATGAVEPVLLDPAAADDLLRRYDISTLPQRLAATPAAAGIAATELGFPVALKAEAASLLHKSDAGGVRLGLASGDDVVAEAEAMARRISGLTGFLVQAMAPPGLELIVGARRDPLFGPLVLVGLGGVWVEVLGDVARRLAPVDHAEALAMLDELRSARLLAGYRGAPPVDRQALAQIIMAVGQLMVDEPGLVEVDLNPVIAGPGGGVVVDARLLQRPPTPCRPLIPAPIEAFRRLMNPASIVVVGASPTRAKQGGRLFHYLIKHGFSGPLYAVNPNATEVMGRPCYPSVSDLPEVPDLACLMVPADAVPGVLEECGAKGIRSAVVYTAGFAEVDDAGRAKQDELVAIARAYGIRLCGPNTAGIVNVAARTCAAFGMAFEAERMPPGEIAFLTQSGALGSSLLSRSWDQGIGFSHWVCTGNEADLTLSDYLAALVEDPATRVVAIFMETLRDPDRFAAACRRARELGKPIVVYKTGTSEAGQRAVLSHTASLAGDDAVYDAFFRAHGVIRVHDLQGLVDAALALAWQPAPRGPRIGVVSASGGACSVVADECARHGLELPALSDDARQRIQAVIPPFGVSQNPVDVTMQITVNPGMVGQVAEVMLGEDTVDALLVLMTTNADPPALEVAKGVVRAASSATKPVIVVRVGAESLAPESVPYYRASRVPLFPMPDRAVRALRAMVAYGSRIAGAREGE
ncbi:MAG TPA: acetate--CoA ligase family protein [Thermomicrobiaceae bacterium]|nr:acetate--CoA ligase family protein [Thermomicrobiaceae bacterium]